MFVDRRALAVVLLGLALTSLASAPSAFQAQSLTGTWSGWLVVKHADKPDKPDESYLHLVLKHTGESLTGTAGPSENEQLKILKGKVAVDKGVTTVTFEFIANSVHTAFTLKLVDGVLKGEAKVEGEDARVHTGAVELKKTISRSSSPTTPERTRSRP